ncbi:MAG: hypothetical protein HOZ81_37690 [Streptomyces sp.]|nr:hypothetical protein [Streptomyces sp.]
MPISNELVTAHPFLKALYEDDYHPQFWFIAHACGFAGADSEELTSGRNW